VDEPIYRRAMKQLSIIVALVAACSSDSSTSGGGLAGAAKGSSSGAKAPLGKSFGSAQALSMRLVKDGLAAVLAEAPAGIHLGGEVMRGRQVDGRVRLDIEHRFEIEFADGGAAATAAGVSRAAKLQVSCPTIRAAPTVEGRDGWLLPDCGLVAVDSKGVGGPVGL
jgi:hypothetical protein